MSQFLWNTNTGLKILNTLFWDVLLNYILSYETRKLGSCSQSCSCPWWIDFMKKGVRPLLITSVSYNQTEHWFQSIQESGRTWFCLEWKQQWAFFLFLNSFSCLLYWLFVTICYNAGNPECVEHLKLSVCFHGCGEELEDGSSESSEVKKQMR